MKNASKLKQMICIIVLCMMIMVLGACSSDDGASYKVIVADPIIMTHHVKDKDLGMEIKGTLQYNDENQCIYITNDSDGKTLLPIWPKGSVPTMENNQYGVNVKEVGMIFEGESVHLAGGGLEEADISSAGYPEECLELVDEIVFITP